MKQDKSERSSNREVRAKKIVERLRSRYGGARTALQYRTPLQLLIATMLSAQCTDKKVNEITPALFSKYKTAADFAAARQEELEQEIRQTGFFRMKAKNIIAAAKKIVEDFNGKVPDTMRELLTLPGVARKTANIVLSSAFKKAEGIAVDVHVARLAGRMGLSSQKNPEKIEQDLMACVPRKDWIEFNYMMVDHGRAVCTARNPKCRECVVRDLCPSADSFVKRSP